LLGTATIALSVKTYHEKQNKAINLANSLEQQDIKTNQIQQATFVIDTPLPTIKLETSVFPKNYFVIAGAFRNENNAIKKVKELKTKGFNAQVVGKNKYDLTQVAFDSYSDLDEANLALQNIKSTVLKDAWLLVKE
jgi:cell division protein FtsN